ncbi:MAG: DUF58 domain-containing protein [Deinococcales bacterium]
MQLRSYRLASRALAVSAGERRSSLAGSGGEFLEHRVYEPGDEVRFIDWNVYARSGKLFVRRFAAERATRVYLTSDISKSMQPKLPIVQAASEFIKPFIRHDRIYSRQVSDLKNGLAQLALERPGLVLLFSDGLEPIGGIRSGLMALTARGFDLSVIQILSSEDLEPPTGVWRVRDAESEATLEIDDAARRRYLERLNAHLEGLAGLCRSLGLRLTRLGDGSPQAIFKALRQAGILERGQ